MGDKAVLLNSINRAATQTFEGQGFGVIPFSKSLPPTELGELLTGVRALGVRSGPAVPDSVLHASDTLEVVGCFCVGTSHVDVDAANKRGIAVFNSAFENTRSVTEFVMNCVSNLLRRTAEHNMAMHEGRWTKTDEQSYEVRNKTLGIIGYGAVGSQVSVLAEGHGMSVLYYDPYPKFPPYGNARQVYSLPELLNQSDIITLHVPGGKATRNLINETTLKLMKRGSYLINTARGEVVDYDAVAVALEDGQLAGVAADVFADEPKNEGDPFDHVLRGQPKALLTPHVAGSTQEAQREIASRTAGKLLAYLATGNSVNCINLPELPAEPIAEGVTRVLHIHDNIPGAAAAFNSIIADYGLNIVGEELRVKGALGYAYADVQGNVHEDMVQEIASNQHTVRVRTVR